MVPTKPLMTLANPTDPKTPRARSHQVATEAAARVPPEPADGEPGAIRVALRLPGGSRLMRRFRGSDPVRCLHDYALAHVPEAAAGRG
jgi:hypothetical protein